MSATFTPASLKFLRSLARHNHREWFTPRKAIFEAELKAPMLALIEGINHDLLDFAPQYVRPARKAMMRIYRDTRFSANKLPYKTQMAAWWSRSGLEKTSGAGFYLSVSAAEVTVAAGCYMPERDQLLAIRRYLSAAGGNRHGDLRAILANSKLLALMRPFDADGEAGAKLTRAPMGFSPEDPALDLLLHRQWGVSASLPAQEALKPTFRKEVVTRLKLAMPLVELLNAPLLAPASKLRPIF